MLQELFITHCINATKHICNSIGEYNPFGKVDCTKYYASVKVFLIKFTAKPKPIFSNINKEVRKALQPQKDKSHMCLTSDKGVALVIIDKDMYIDKLMALLNDEDTYCECTIQTKYIQSKVMKLHLDPKTSIGPEFKDQYIKLHPPGDNSPPARFYSLPKMYKAIIPFRPIVLECSTSTYISAKFQTKILQPYCVNNFLFVKDGKGLAESMKDQRIVVDEMVYFDVSALLASIPVPVALGAISRICTEHLNQTGMEHFVDNTHLIPTDKVISLLELVLNNCIFLQGKFYQQVQGM